MNWLLFTGSALLLAVSVTADSCPGGEVRCPDFMTCCEISIDEYGCCPFPDAKCCADHVHCCPHNMDCDIAHQSCVRNGSFVQFKWQVAVRPEIVEPVLPEDTSEKEVNDLQQLRGNLDDCPDKTKCRSNFTCCKMYSGKYGCCPFDSATCCKDGFHCCPHTSQCSASGECHFVEGNYKLNAYPLKDKKHELLRTAQASRKLHRQEVSDPGGLCPDGHPCPEKYTCCKINGKRYGCCPYSDARCCDDGIHCCPKGSNCNTTLGTCDIQTNLGTSFPTKSRDSLQWSKVTKTPMEVILSDVVCPDERYHCPSGTTCCDLGSGVYGCCMMEKAICCSDKTHCCPYGYSCITDGCQKGSNHLPPFLWTVATEKTPHEKLVEKDVSAVICPDKYPCPDRNTCCELKTGEYGCCPMEKATCCADKVHCCPQDYRCLDDGCRKESGLLGPHPLILIALKINNKSQVAKDLLEEIKQDHSVECPDKKSECPDGSTCCQLVSGDYGCCPYEAATCCGDQIHCCPHGYWCNDEGCDRIPGMPQHLAPFLQKLFIAKMIPTV